MSGPPDPQQEQLHLVVHGRVQGVGFRWFIRQTARRLQLRGWVRNNADGSVELLAAGARQALSALETAARRGPAGALVTGVDTAASDPSSPADLLPMPFTVCR